MTSATTSSNTYRSPDASRSRGRAVYSVLIGLSTLGVLLQGLWAGIFLEGENRPDKWVNVHARGAEVTIAVTVLALIAAFVWLRHRRDLLIGTVVLLVALVAEAYIGGLITDDGKDSLTAVHVPLAMAVMGLAVWLPIRTRGRRAESMAPRRTAYEVPGTVR